MQKSAQSIIGYNPMLHVQSYTPEQRRAIDDWWADRWYALRHGRIPIPGLTVYDSPYKNPPIPKAGPLTFAVTGAGWGASDDPYTTGLSREYYPSAALSLRNQGPSVRLYRWIDHAAALRDMREAAKAGHPIRVIGHSYGGSTARELAEQLGSSVESLTTIDPVSRSGGYRGKPENVGAWYNVTPGNTAVHNNIGNLIATIGGRWGTIPAATTNIVAVGSGHHNFNPMLDAVTGASTGAAEGSSAPAVSFDLLERLGGFTYPAAEAARPGPFARPAAASDTSPLVKSSALSHVDTAGLAGLAGGALLGGLGGYFIPAKNRRRRLLNALLLGLTGGAAGTYLGRVGASHVDFVKRRAAAMAQTAGAEKRPGKVYYVDHPDNSTDISKTGIGPVDSVVSRLMKLTGWDGVHNIGHSGIMTVDSDGNATTYDYGKFGRGPDVEVLTDKFSVKGLSDAEIAKKLQGMQKHWGKTVNLYSADVPDIGVAERYIQGITSPGSDAFSPIPGGYTCGSVARDAFEAARGSRLGHWLDMLTGGYPTSNAPTYKTVQTGYSATE